MNKMFYIVLFFFSISMSYAERLYPLQSVKQEAQFAHLLKDLRCLVCQNQNLADSNADIAKDLKQEVYQLVIAGKTDQEIIGYLTARYGEFILFNPPLTWVTLILWLGPFIFLLVGFIIFFHYSRRISQNR